jgi:hypothetical protein
MSNLLYKELILDALEKSCVNGLYDEDMKNIVRSFLIKIYAKNNGLIEIKRNPISMTTHYYSEQKNEIYTISDICSSDENIIPIFKISPNNNKLNYRMYLRDHALENYIENKGFVELKTNYASGRYFYDEKTEQAYISDGILLPKFTITPITQHMINRNFVLDKFDQRHIIKPNVQQCKKSKRTHNCSSK